MGLAIQDLCYTRLTLGDSTLWENTSETGAGVVVSHMCAVTAAWLSTSEVVLIMAAPLSSM